MCKNEKMCIGVCLCADVNMFFVLNLNFSKLRELFFIFLCVVANV